MIEQADVNVYEGQVHKDVLYWLPARGERADLQLAIVIDDADTKIGNQLEQLRKFIQVQPNTTTIGLYYASNGTIQAASQLNPDHNAVAKSLRLPIGTVGNFSSIYQALSQLMSGWPSTEARREILVITEGFDAFSSGLDSPAADAAANAAQSRGIIIYPLFVKAVGRSAPFASTGLDYLSELANATGGDLLFLGMDTPPSFEPYLSRLSTVLHNQYFLVWRTTPSRTRKGQLRSFKVRLEEENVRFTAADKIFVPALP